MSTWSEVHTMTSTTENVSLQESRNGDSLTFDPTVVHSEVANASDEFPQDDHFEFDIDDLKDQLGIDHIMQSLNALNEKLVGLGGVASLPESGNTAAKSDTVDSVFSHDAVFDPTAVISTEQTSASTSGADSTKQLDSSVFLPSVFEEKESFGSAVADVIAQRVNDACSKKPLESKFKELQDKYKTPQNCKFLCVPKVNLELWHDLPRHTKSKDLGIQEVQKNIVKSAQPLVQLFDSVLVAQNQRKMLQPSEILPVIGDAITFLGHASFLASLKRREFLKPDIAVAYQFVCSKSNPVTTVLFGDELPKHIKDIGEVNKIAKKTVVRSSLVHRNSDYKSSSNNSKYSQRGQKPFLGLRGHRAHFSEWRPAARNHPPQSSEELRDKA